LRGDGSWVSIPTPDADKITEGNTEAEVVDTGSDGHFKVTTEGSERLRVVSDGRIGIGTDVPNTLTRVSIQMPTAGGAGAITVQSNLFSVLTVNLVLVFLMFLVIVVLIMEHQVKY
jgi:hypothetical protein